MGYCATTSIRRSGRTPKTAYPRSAIGVSGLRYYSPSLGRWLSRDPKGEAFSLNSYAYVTDAHTLSGSRVVQQSSQAIAGPPVDPAGGSRFEGGWECTRACRRKLIGCENAGAARACCEAHERMHEPALSRNNWCKWDRDRCGCTTNPGRANLKDIGGLQSWFEDECTAHLASLQCCLEGMKKAITLKERKDFWLCASNASGFRKLRRGASGLPPCPGNESDPDPGPEPQP
jgi:hypothetical protein